MEYKIETRCLHTDISPETGIIHPLSEPIYQTATFVHTKIGKYGAYDYTRESNPTRTCLEQKISSLEHASDTLAFANGMAAITACMELFSPGDSILSGGSAGQFQRINLACSRATLTQALEQLRQAVKFENKYSD